MRRSLYFIVLFLGHIIYVSAQSEFIANPSFEDSVGQGHAPKTWYSCNDLSTPDTRPYSSIDKFLPTDGQSYLGLVMRGLMDPLPKNEDVTTKLLKPLYRDSTYYMSIDAVLVPYEYDYFGNQIFYYNNPSRIRISGGNDSCSVNEVFAVSNLITDTVWKRLYFKITPTIDSCTYLKIEIYLDTMKASYICLDNMTFDKLKIYGPDTLCDGRQHASYRIPEIPCDSDFKWNYSGTGATIIGNSENIFINFDSTATSGNLSVSFNNCGEGTKTLSLPIMLRSRSANDPGEITGLSEVCAGQKVVSYHVAGKNSAIYNWSYSGTGALINPVSDSVSIDFAENATSGNLKVSVNSACDSYFPITVIPLPSDGREITGDFEFCPDQKKAPFATTKIANASKYIWTFYGSGATINGNSDSVTVDFSPDATSGFITVYGKNRCGTGTPAQAKYLTIEPPAPIGTGPIFGENEVCQNQRNVLFNTAMYYATNYSWNYDGTGATIKGNSASIYVDFSPNATSGDLTVTGSNKCGELKLPKFPITIKPLPSPAGEIMGEKEICPNQNNLIYKVSPIDHANDYLWSYDGNGASISGFADSIAIDFSKNVTSGNLTVSGQNSCGTGTASPVLPISVGSVPPAMEIVGKNEVCADHNTIFYVRDTGNATDYTWDYSGNGAVMQTNNDTLNIKFTKIESSEVLTVTGSNQCGTGDPSLPLPIKVDLCDLHIPNSFTPNGDGINDLFVIKGLIENSKLIVFDRLGKIVYKSENYQNDWNGNSMTGEKLPSDTYWYVLSVEGISTPFKGFIYLKR